VIAEVGVLRSNIFRFKGFIRAKDGKEDMFSFYTVGRLAEACEKALHYGKIVCIPHSDMKRVRGKDIFRVDRIIFGGHCFSSD